MCTSALVSETPRPAIIREDYDQRRWLLTSTPINVNIIVSSSGANCYECRVFLTPSVCSVRPVALRVVRMLPIHRKGGSTNLYPVSLDPSHCTLTDILPLVRTTLVSIECSTFTPTDCTLGSIHFKRTHNNLSSWLRSSSRAVKLH